jgi:hypothetical protein
MPSRREDGWRRDQAARVRERGGEGSDMGIQQILGSCSPDSISTTRRPPIRLRWKTRPG